MRAALMFGRRPDENESQTGLMAASPPAGIVVSTEQSIRRENVMSIGKLVVLVVAVALAAGGVGSALAESDDGFPGEAIELLDDARKDELNGELVAQEDDGDGDDTNGNDGTGGGNDTGPDGDDTAGNDRTGGGENTGDGDATGGNDGTNGGDNTASPGAGGGAGGGGGGDTGGGTGGGDT